MLPNRVQSSELFGSMSHSSDWSRDSQFSELSSSQSIQSQTNSRLDFSQSFSQQYGASQNSALGEKAANGESCQLNSYYLNYISKPPLFKKPSDKSKCDSQPSLTNMIKLKCQTQDKDNRAMFDSLSSFVQQCATEVKESVESLREMIRSWFDTMESKSAHTVDEVRCEIASQHRGLMEKFSNRQEHELKIDRLSYELKLRDEKIDALVEEAKLVEERRAEFSSLCEKIGQYEEEMKQQRELICTDVRDIILSFVSRLERWNYPHMDTENDVVHETERGKQSTEKEATGTGKETASESPLLDTTPPLCDLSMSEQTVPSCDGSCDSFYPDSRTSDSFKLLGQSKGKSGHHRFRHTKVVFVKSRSCKGRKRHRSKPTSSHDTSQYEEEEERTNTVVVDMHCLSPDSGKYDKRPVPITPTSVATTDKSINGKGKTRQKRPLVVEPTSDETAWHISRVGAMLSHRSRPD